MSWLNLSVQCVFTYFLYFSCFLYFLQIQKTTLVTEKSYFFILFHLNFHSQEGIFDFLL